MDTFTTLFDHVPNELIFMTLDYSDPQHALIFSELFPEIYSSERFLTMMRKNVYDRSGVRTNNMSLESLSRFSKIRYNKHIHAGCNQSIIVTYDNMAYKLGSIDVRHNSELLAPILKGKDIQSVSTRGFSAKLLTLNREVYTFGDHDLPDDYVLRDKIFTPSKISDISDVVAVSDGYDHTLFLLSQGIVYGSGDISGSFLESPSTPFSIIQLSDIIQISAGHYFSLALKSDGTVYGFGELNTQPGNHYYGQIVSETWGGTDVLTLIPNLNNIVAVTAGNKFSLALRSDGKVYAFGTLPIKFDHVKYEPFILPNLPPIVQVSIGLEHALLLAENGDVYGFGQLGLKESEPIYSTNDNILESQWRGTDSKITSDEKLAHIMKRLNISQETPKSDLINIVANEMMTRICSLQIKMDRIQGRINHTKPVTSENIIKIPGLSNIVEISAGAHHSLVLDNEGKIYSFGKNNCAQLGFRDFHDRGSPSLIPFKLY